MVGQVNAVTDGLIGYWAFDEENAGATVSDSSGGAHDGTPQGTPGPQPDSTLPSIRFFDPKSLQFAGADYVEVPDSPELNPSDVTVAVWVRLNSLPATPQTLVAKWQEGQKQQFLLQIDTDGTVNFWTDNGTNFNPTKLTSVSALNTDTWYNIVASITGTSRALYINGLADHYSDTGEAVSTSDVPISFGANKDSGGTYTSFLDGFLDDLRIYNRSLSDDEITNLAGGLEANPQQPLSGPMSQPEAPAQCNNQPPKGDPELFQIDAHKNSADLYFKTTSDGADGYEIFYGLNTNADQYSYHIDYNNHLWITKLTINDLDSNQTYYFKVRAKSGCNAGDFGNTLQMKTTSSGQKNYYKSIISQIVSGITTASGGTCQYTVKGGDSYWSIAKAKYGNGVRYLQLIALNPTIKLLRPGNIINISCQ